LLLYAAKVIAKQEGLEDGYRIVINDGPSGCMSLFHALGLVNIYFLTPFFVGDLISLFCRPICLSHPCPSSWRQADELATGLSNACLLISLHAKDVSRISLE
jgi:hypothetical protein